MDDEQLLAMKKNGGVVQVVALCQLREAQQPAARHRARRRWADGAGAPPGEAPARVPDRESRGSARRLPPPGAPRSRTSSTTSTTPCRLIGIDHVGISSDFDGGGGIDGWNSAAETFNVTLELVRRGYGEKRHREAVERQPASCVA